MKTNRVAMFTPLPPSRTGTADYASALVPELEKLCRLELFEKVPRTFHAAEFDHVIYQIGNNPFHADFYRQALRDPGVVVLHDPNLHDLIRNLTASRDGAYLREVHYELFGEEWRSGHANAQPISDLQPPVLTMSRRLLSRSKGCIVHSRAAEDHVRMKGFRGPVARIAHGASQRVPDAAKYRGLLGIRPEQPLVGLFGYLRPDKEPDDCVRVFRRMLEWAPDAHMLVAGQEHEEVDFGNAGERVRVLGFQSPEDFDGYIGACDVVLNLRWPTFGESSGITARALGMGKTVIAWDCGAHTDLPDDVCVRIPRDRFRFDVLDEVLRLLFRDRTARDTIGANAALWSAETCSWKSTAQRYLDFLLGGSTGAPAGKVEKSLNQQITKWVKPGSPQAQYVKSHEARLVRTLELTPKGTEASRVLELGCYLQITPVLGEVYEYGEVRGSYLGTGASHFRTVEADSGERFQCAIDLFDCEKDIFPYQDDYFATVLCCELLEHLERDPMKMLLEIHRVLQPNGVLILTTPNIASAGAVAAVLEGRHPGFYTRYASDPGHRREYTTAEVADLLTAAGFAVEHLETGPYGSVDAPATERTKQMLAERGYPNTLRDDCIFAVARQEALPVDRYPAWLYDA